jgi:hypothetical protein
MGNKRLRNFIKGLTAFLGWVGPGGGAALAGEMTPEEAGRRLKEAYPDHITAVEGEAVVWRDGTRLTLDDGRGAKPFDDLVRAPDLQDIFAIPYPTGPLQPPAVDADPGRPRPEAFFDRMYGNCRAGEVAKNLVDVAWMPSRGRTTLKVTRVNGVAEKLKAVSDELEQLPRSFDRYLIPVAGTYACRVIAGTERLSTHGHGIAIDLALKHSDYWRWSKPDAVGRYAWQNKIPEEIVRIFEKHGFIWGGRWYHYDTMHFEYRPELLVK